jgi:hypothetical protein
MASSALIALVGDGGDLEAMRFTRRDNTRHGRSPQAPSKMLAMANEPKIASVVEGGGVAAQASLIDLLACCREPPGRPHT